jgi:hypothetical protein
MDPITLFMMANSAVAAVKKGCQLYKDIKGAAGDVKAVLKDLDQQFHSAHPPEKPASAEARKQFIEEKNRIIDLNKRDGETTGIYTELGEHLGAYYDNYYKCMAIFEEEEKRAKTEVYEGGASLGKRALQRVLMRKQLEQMGTELREIMVYQSPPELGALHSEVEEMMEVMGKQQKVLMVKQIQKDYADKQRKKRRLQKLRMEIALGFVAIMVASTFGLMIAYVVQDRIEKYPELGTEWRPKTEAQRQREAIPQKYTGR